MEDASDLLPTVFVSYAHEDKPIAHSLAGALGERGCSVWVDEFELRAGDSLTERVSGALTSADFVVAMVSTASVNSDWCRRELQMALSTGLAAGRTIVLPVRLGEVAMPPSLTDLFYVSAEVDRADEAAERLVRDMRSHAAEVTTKREADTTEREWEFALEPAHELDSVLGDLEHEMDYLRLVDASRKGKTTYDQAFARWMTIVDKWHAGSRLPHVMHELAWRLEGLLEVAAHYERTYRRNQGVIRRLNRIAGSGIIETRELLSAVAKDPALFASTALEDCSIPTREELFAIVRDDPRLFTLQSRSSPAWTKIRWESKALACAALAARAAWPRCSSAKASLGAQATWRAVVESLRQRYARSVHNRTSGGTRALTVCQVPSRSMMGRTRALLSDLD